MKRVAATMLLLTAMAIPASAQTVNGTVMDSTTNTRIAGAQVMIIQVDSSASMVTDSTGKFRFRALAGPFTLFVRALGYQEMRSGVMQVGKNENLSILIFPSATPVEVLPLIVIGRSKRPLSDLEAFQQRMKREAFGFFMDQKKIEKIYEIQT